MKHEMRKYIDTFKQKLTESENLNISDVIKSLTLEDITNIVGAFSDLNVTEEMVRKYIELNYL
jgi:predicted Zn-dependent protease with MMP-like domain